MTKEQELRLLKQSAEGTQFFEARIRISESGAGAAGAEAKPKPKRDIRDIFAANKNPLKV
jgi:hypothetical protein